MKAVILLLVVVVIVAVVVLAVVLGRLGRRSHQRYSGLEQQRASGKQSREAGVDRLKQAERQLVDAQRALIDRGEHGPAQETERIRRRISTVADRQKSASYGYAPLGSPTPIQESELADLQAHDEAAVLDAETIVDLARTFAASVRAGDTPDLEPLRAAVQDFEDSLDRRKRVA